MFDCDEFISKEQISDSTSQVIHEIENFTLQFQHSALFWKSSPSKEYFASFSLFEPYPSETSFSGLSRLFMHAWSDAGKWKFWGVAVVKGGQNLPPPPGWNRVNWSAKYCPQPSQFRHHWIEVQSFPIQCITEPSEGLKIWREISETIGNKIQIVGPQSLPLYSNCFDLLKKIPYRAGLRGSTICTSDFFTFRRPCNTFSASIPNIVSKAVGYRESITYYLVGFF